MDANSQASAPDGTEWSKAYPNPESAFARIANGDPFDEVWIAEGTYLPQGGSQSSTFLVPNDVSVYGAFRSGDMSVETRTGSARSTILSGDIGLMGNMSDNCFHVVTVEAGLSEVRLDGLTIDGGNADGSTPEDTVGAGILCTDSDLWIEGCFVTSNMATEGGGLYFGPVGNPSAPPVTAGLRVHRSFFLNNFARRTGGAIHLEEYGIPSTSAPNFSYQDPSWIINTQFERNSAGVTQTNDSALLAQGGGAIWFGDRLENVGNSSTIPLSVRNLGMAVGNCKFTNNAVRGRGAAILLSDTASNAAAGQLLIINSTLAFNLVLQFDQAALAEGGPGTIWVDALETNSAFPINAIVSSIVYNTTGAGGSAGVGDAITGPGSNSDRVQPLATPFEGLFARFSDIEITLGGPTDTYGLTVPDVIDDDPQFVDPAIRDLRLGAGSPCVNEGLNLGSPTVIEDWPDMDNTPGSATNGDEIPRELFTSRLREVGRIDMGCHERPASGN